MKDGFDIISDADDSRGYSRFYQHMSGSNSGNRGFLTTGSRFYDRGEIRMCTLEVKKSFIRPIFHGTYEPEEGIFDFGGNKDVERFVELAGDMGLYVILDAENLAMEVKELLKRASINLYMFQGGTNFGFYNGCSARGYTDLPQITSYNYDAILTGWRARRHRGMCGYILNCRDLC